MKFHNVTALKNTQREKGNGISGAWALPTPHIYHLFLLAVVAFSRIMTSIGEDHIRGGIISRP